jgi:preprotein translocase subunit YajC
VGTAFAQTGGSAAGGPPPLVSFFPVVAVIAVFYLVLIRPEQKKRKEQEHLLAGLKRNDLVVMVSGIHGRVLTIGDKTVTVEIAPKVPIQVDLSAIQSLEKAAVAEVREKEREKEKS